LASIANWRVGLVVTINLDDDESTCDDDNDESTVYSNSRAKR
jgi:hypothetical protein